LKSGIQCKQPSGLSTRVSVVTYGCLGLCNDELLLLDV